MRDALLRSNLEAILTLQGGFGLTTATPMQRAICRIADGLPLAALAEDEVVQRAVGDVSLLPSVPPRELYLLSGIRTGKSLLAAALAVRASQTCDVSRLGPGETPRVSVLSIKLDLAKVVYDHILGSVREKLPHLLIGEPTADSIVLRHPSGRAVEVKVVAGARAGASLVARWSAGCIFDEAPRMVGAEDGVINFDDAYAAVLGRLLPGAQIVAIGSPWAPFGPIYDVVQEHWGKPSRDVVVIRAPAWAMNPVTWTPEAMAELEQSKPAVYRTDVLGEFMDPESSLFTHDVINEALRDGDVVLPPDPLRTYVAVIDPATRGNAWTLVVLSRSHLGNLQVVLCREWVGSPVEPLSPEAVLHEIAALLRPYRCYRVVSDQWSADALRDLARQVDLGLDVENWTSQSKLDAFESLKVMLTTGQLELAPVPSLVADLLRVRKRVTQAGLRIELPQTSDGRHCDYAAALALGCMQQMPRARQAPPGPPKGWTEAEVDQADEYAAQLGLVEEDTSFMCNEDL